jgi:hypothetical protein
VAAGWITGTFQFAAVGNSGPVLAAQGGEAEVLSQHDTHEVPADGSPDGSWAYSVSNRTGAIRASVFGGTVLL